MSATVPSCSGDEPTAGTSASSSREISHADLQAMKAASDTVKKNPGKSEFSQGDLLRLLSYLEGELQAREVVIAALKSENIKQHIYATRGIIVGSHDPQAALFRDQIVSTGNFVSRPSSALAAQSELAVRQFARQKLDTLQNVIYEQRHAHVKLIGVLKDFEDKHKTLLHQLNEEKQKHERDTAQGDDITYGLEVERTRLRADLESERAQTKRQEKDAKKQQETLEAERSRQKTIVLLLLAERKRIIMKYMEERKRSEDLAQILSEEKLRVDTISEGLEEESKKSLRMEAELEAFEMERKQYASSLAGSEIKIREQEQELAQLRLELLRKQQQHDALLAQQQQQLQRMQLPQKSMVGRSNALDTGDDCAMSSTASPLMSSVTKVVQPTSTVSSVPVSGPTTGIARSMSPGQTMRAPSMDAVAAGGGVSPYGATVKQQLVPRKLSNVTAPSSSSSSSSTPQHAAGINPTVAIATHHVQQTQQPQLAGKLMLNNSSNSSGSGSNMSTIKKTPATLPLGRGVPPPIPPNKPIVPPKREPSVTRMGSVTSMQSPAAASATSAAAVANVANSSAAAAVVVAAAAAASPMATGVAVATSGIGDDTA